MSLSTLVILLAALQAAETSPKAPPANADLGGRCVECHQTLTPSIVSDWKLSKHFQNDVECSTCHGDAHTTAEDVAKVQIPTPETCAVCHEQQVVQFKKGKHSLAWAAMKAMPTAHWQPMALMEGMKGCGGCHKIGLKTADEMKELKKTGSGFWGGFL